MAPIDRRWAVLACHGWGGAIRREAIARQAGALFIAKRHWEVLKGVLQDERE